MKNMLFVIFVNILVVIFFSSCNKEETIPLPAQKIEEKFFDIILIIDKTACSDTIVGIRWINQKIEYSAKKFYFLARHPNDCYDFIWGAVQFATYKQIVVAPCKNGKEQTIFDGDYVECVDVEKGKIIQKEHTY